jgi:drug/metabolite transporter (DMT)-like permease
MFGFEFAAIGLGLASALSWGSGDFCGGQATKRASVLPVLVLAEASGLVGLLLLALFTGEPWPDQTTLLWSLAAGVAGLVGLASLYQGLAIGGAALVAPISAVLAAAIPVIFSIFTVGLPGGVQVGGFALSLLGIWLIAGETMGEGGERRGLGMALLAGLGFGWYFVFTGQAGEGGTYWPTALARAVALAVVLPIWLLRRGRNPVAMSSTALLLGLVSGLFDAGGNAFYVLASQSGRLDVAAVLASLYPASTVLLARLVLGERLGPRRIGGLLAVLLAIGLISAS